MTDHLLRDLHWCRQQASDRVCKPRENNIVLVHRVYSTVMIFVYVLVYVILTMLSQ